MIVANCLSDHYLLSTIFIRETIMILVKEKHQQRSHFIRYLWTINFNTFAMTTTTQQHIEKWQTWAPGHRIFDISHLVNDIHDYQNYGTIATAWHPHIYVIFNQENNKNLLKLLGIVNNISTTIKVLLINQDNYIFFASLDLVNKVALSKFLNQSECTSYECKICCHAFDNGIVCTDCGERLCNDCSIKIHTQQVERTGVCCPFCKSSLTDQNQRVVEIFPIHRFV